MDKTSGLYKIAAKIIKKVKSGSNYKSELYQSQYPVSIIIIWTTTFKGIGNGVLFIQF